jgi:hypothetical protein
MLRRRCTITLLASASIEDTVGEISISWVSISTFIETHSLISNLYVSCYVSNMGLLSPSYSLSTSNLRKCQEKTYFFRIIITLVAPLFVPVSLLYAKNVISIPYSAHQQKQQQP